MGTQLFGHFPIRLTHLPSHRVEIALPIRNHLSHEWICNYDSMFRMIPVRDDDSGRWR